MSKIDPQLKYLQTLSKQKLSELESLRRYPLMVKGLPKPKVKVLIQFTGDIAALKRKGFESHSVIGDVATGAIELERISVIAELKEVVGIEASRPMHRLLDVSLPETRADEVHSHPDLGYRGSGVIVGIIDGPVDFTHPSFLKSGILWNQSRILAIWDQALTPQGEERHASSFNYGVEYTQADINSALLNTDPFSVVRHKEEGTEVWPASYLGHGSHVAGIATGDGSISGNSHPAFTYVGVAPEADLIVVTPAFDEEVFGDAASILDAIQYIFDKATALQRPVVINMSMGDNLGSHDGTSLMERGIDSLLGDPGRAMVVATGNSGDANTHASGLVNQGGSLELRLNGMMTSEETIDIWYSGQDRFGVSITNAGGYTCEAVNPGETRTLDMPCFLEGTPEGEPRLGMNHVFIDSVENASNGDNRIFIKLLGDPQTLELGIWKVTLHGQSINDNGAFDAWIEEGMFRGAAFVGECVDRQKTTIIPATSHEVISVGSYVTKGIGIDMISTFSSLGPTRDGRLKPDITAPGESIWSAKSYGEGDNFYCEKRGTSMAAPHVAGTIALMFEEDPTLTQDQIRERLCSAARHDVYTGFVPNTTWGHGKLNARGVFSVPYLDQEYVGVYELFAPNVRKAMEDSKAFSDPKAWRDPKPWQDTLPFWLERWSMVEGAREQDPRPIRHGRRGRGVPFALATPRTARIASRRDVESWAKTTAQCQECLESVEAVLLEMSELLDRSPTDTDLEAYVQIYREYQSLLAQFRILSLKLGAAA